MRLSSRDETIRMSTQCCGIQEGHTGGVVAVPVAADILDRALAYLGDWILRVSICYRITAVKSLAGCEADSPSHPWMSRSLFRTVHWILCAPDNFLQVAVFSNKITYIRTRFGKSGICSDKTVSECHLVFAVFFSSWKKCLFEEFWCFEALGKGTFLRLRRTIITIVSKTN